MVEANATAEAMAAMAYAM
jgi:hypothetical protein